jgi:hypothetical protein
VGHSVKRCCPQCGAGDWSRYPHRLWVQAHVRSPVREESQRLLAASPIRVFRYRACGGAFRCGPAGGRQRMRFLLLVDPKAGGWSGDLTPW